MAVIIINLEQGMPTVQVALTKLNQALRTAKATGISTIKFIHGYGSSGQGGVIRQQVLLELEKHRRKGMVKLVVPGEEFSPFFDNARRAIDLYPDLTRDRDYARTNHGITIVIV